MSPGIQWQKSCTTRDCSSAASVISHRMLPRQWESFTQDFFAEVYQCDTNFLCLPYSWCRRPWRCARRLWTPSAAQAFPLSRTLNQETLTEFPTVLRKSRFLALFSSVHATSQRGTPNAQSVFARNKKIRRLSYEKGFEFMPLFATQSPVPAGSQAGEVSALITFERMIFAVRFQAGTRVPAVTRHRRKYDIKSKGREAARSQCFRNAFGVGL